MSTGSPHNVHKINHFRFGLRHALHMVAAQAAEVKSEYEIIEFKD
jgi:hypothetical protein